MSVLRITHLAAVVASAAFCCGLSPVAAETVYFLVAERPGSVAHGDSYVLPISDPAAIAHARALISAEPGTLPAIVVANIAAGADGINRDYLAEGAPLWSWHVTEFIAFADFTAEILDGGPRFVEAVAPNTGGTIGFWNYTVTAELDAVPEPTSAGLLAAGLAAAAFARRRIPKSTPRETSLDEGPPCVGARSASVPTIPLPAATTLLGEGQAVVDGADAVLDRDPRQQRGLVRP